MKNKEFLAKRAELTTERFALCDAKAVEYTKGSDDRHANFKRIAALLGLTPVQVLMVYLQKHLDAIYHGITSGEAGTERMKDRFMDAQNYLDLFYTLVEEMGGVTETRFRPGTIIEVDSVDDGGRRAAIFNEARADGKTMLQALQESEEKRGFEMRRHS